jgi:hypothetical protein
MIVGGGEAKDPFWEITKTLTIKAYSDFRAIGYKDEQIIYHIKSTNLIRTVMVPFSGV